MEFPDLGVVQTALAYTFRHPAFLEEALTHRSFVNEVKRKDERDNERLEFLGDAVLSVIVSDYLITTFPQETEGQLSKKKAKLVSETSLARAARTLQLGHYLRLGRGEERTNGREKNSLLADAMEAVIAAVYLDGGLTAAQDFTHLALAQAYRDLKDGVDVDVLEDFKTRYQEWCQKERDVLPRYLTVSESGPDHQKTFEVHVLLKTDIVGMGVGRTKKEAEQRAAQQALAQIDKCR